MIDWVVVFGVVIPLMFSAFFSGIEIAFISADRVFLELQTQRRGLNSRALRYLIQNPSYFLTATLLGNTASLVVYGSSMTFLTQPYIDGFVTNEILSLIIATLVSTLLVLLLAEFLPKSLFLLRPNQSLAFLAIPFFVIFVILFPVVFVVDSVSRFVIETMFKVEYSVEKPVYQLTDLNNYLKEVVSKTVVNENTLDIETEILTNALQFKAVKVRDCMIPRIELEAVEEDATIEELKQRFVKTGFSKIIVYRESVDNIIGYCHSSQLFKKPESIKGILSSIDFVPETALANDVMVELIQKRKSIAVVVDEFGGTSGIVAIEDIIEQIFGEINDEHDKENLVEVKLDNNNFLFSARHEITYLNTEYNFDLPEGEYETLGGLILSQLGEIPEKEDVIELTDYVLTVKHVDGVKIDKVKLTLSSVN